MRKDTSLGFSAAVLVLTLVGAIPCAAQDRAGNAPAKAVAPAGDDAKPPSEAPAPARDPAGMVRFQGGRVRVGIDRKVLFEHTKTTEVGRTGNWEIAFENELSFCTPEVEMDVPAFWIGKYEVTNAQWHRFLESAGKVIYTIPPKGQPGERTLEEISRRFSIAERFKVQGGGWHYPVAVNWEGLYEINEEVLNPTKDSDGKDIDPKTRPPAATFKDKALPPGTKLTCYRYTVPVTWKVKKRLRGSPPPGHESHPVACVSLVDAMAFAQFYGCHIPTEAEWEGSARGAGGTIYPEGKEFHPLGHAWKGFNNALEKAQAEAKTKLPRAKEEAEQAKTSGNDNLAAKTKALVEYYETVQRMKLLPDPLDPPCVEVGMFPLGRSPCGALDQLGNVDEWVSTPLVEWPGCDTKSGLVGITAFIWKGANLNDRDTLLIVPYRKFLSGAHAIGKTTVSTMAGFRVARYESPGASAASHAIPEISASSPPVLPREYDERAKKIVGPDLNIYGAVGIERLHETPWAQGQPQEQDPAGKVFYLGRAASLCIVPPTGMKHRDPDAIRKAAATNPIPSATEGKKKYADPRQPRDIPFLGLLHLSERIEIKTVGLREIDWVEVPLTAEEIKALKDEREARKKAAEPAPEPEGKPGEEPPKDGGGGEKKPGDKMAGDDKPERGKAPPKGEGDGGKKPPEGEKPAGDAPAEGDEGAKEDEEDGEKEAPLPTTKKVQKVVHKPIPLKGKDHPKGLLLGLLKHGGEIHPVLWEARAGNVGSSAPGGTVMLEEPLAILDKNALSFRKVTKPGLPTSDFQEVEGTLRLTFFVPVEGKSAGAIEVTLNLQLSEFPAASAGSPWVSTRSRSQEAK